MDREMHRIILKVQGSIDDNVDPKIPRHGKRLLGMHKCIQGRLRKRLYARRSSDPLHLKEVKKA
jgi:hypothetical protein